MNTVIKVENLGKKYIIGHQQEKYIALRDVIANGFSNIFKRGNKNSFSKEEFWALKDINFEVKKGDRLGIIGKNGAGKSTILKILSRITEPSIGRVSINGRVASLLEVGTGFHPELTGRENIYLNGAVLGMSRSEIKHKFDEIVAFAEVEKFLDTPVKRYSSGMYVRLAFAVAAHLESEMLLVDEVLAVGDFQFRKKCLKKMKDVSMGEDKTVLFVSHDMCAIQNICNKAILLDKGRIGFIGEVDEVIKKYMSETESMLKISLLDWTPKKSYPFSEIVQIKRFYITDEAGNIPRGMLYNSKKYTINIDAHLLQADSRLIFSMAFYDGERNLIFTSDIHDSGGMDFSALKTGHIKISVDMPIDLFLSRMYSVELLCCFHHLGWVLPPDNDSRLRFEVFRDMDLNPYANESRLGMLAPTLKWKIN